MTDEARVMFIILGVLLALCVIVGLTLNHHIGGFLETVAREEEEQAEDKKEDLRRDTGE